MGALNAVSFRQTAAANATCGMVYVYSTYADPFFGLHIALYADDPIKRRRQHGRFLK